MSLAEVRLQEGESVENALRRFKRKVQTEDIIKEIKRHSFYLKPGAKRRVKQALAQQRARKKVRKEALVACRRVTITIALASKLSWPVAAKSCSPSNSILT